MTHEEALKKLRNRLVDDVKDLEREIIRLNEKHETYMRAVDLIESLLQEVNHNENNN